MTYRPSTIKLITNWQNHSKYNSVWSIPNRKRLTTNLAFEDNTLDCYRKIYNIKQKKAPFLRLLDIIRIFINSSS